jgi:hypothetical protein
MKSLRKIRADFKKKHNFVETKCCENCKHMRRYFDEETNEWVDKALVVVDGKVLNPTGFVKILKG